jgi:hypothetical protein
MLKQVTVHGEQVIIGGSRAALVASRSQPGHWHIVRDDRCDCLGYTYRGNCRHLRLVALAFTSPTVIPDPDTFLLHEQTLTRPARPSDAAPSKEG